jgi:hypothetical protein
MFLILSYFKNILLKATVAIIYNYFNNITAIPLCVKAEISCRSIRSPLLYVKDIITGMNPKASCGLHTLRIAGLFNLPIPIRFAFGIGVSQ